MTTDLRALVEKATPGPWRFVDPSVEDCEIAAGVERVMAGGYTEGGSINKPVKQADIDLIVAAVNALPGLLDKIDELQAALDAQAGMVMVPRVDIESLRNCSDSDMQDGDFARQLASLWLAAAPAGPAEGGDP